MLVIFVDNLLYEGSPAAPRFDLQPHLGLLSLVAVARAAGHEAAVYDPKYDLIQGRLRLDASLYAAMAERILAGAPSAVGFTALGCNFHCVANVAAHVKRLRPEVPVLLGGPHATILHAEILARFAAFDVVVRSEAEATIVPLLERLGARELGDLPGISYRTSGGEVRANPDSPLVADLDGLPVPAYDCYPLAELGLRTIRVEAGRGCPFSCTFCSTASFFGRSYRLKSAARLLAEMDALHRTYGYTDFKLNHDLFTVNRKKVVEFCEAMLDRRYTWGCSARVDCVDPELLDLMWRAGCRNVYFGIEAGSARMQAVSRKRLDLSLVEPTLDVTARLGMRTTTSFITGYPEEERDDQAATLDLAARYACRPDGTTTSQLHLLTPEPGTQLMAQYGDRLRYDGYVSDFNFPQLDPGDDALIACHPLVFGNHHYFPSVLPRHRHVFVSSAWLALHAVGPAVLGYTLRAFGGRLSSFVEAALVWYADTEPRAWSVGPNDLTAFLAARLGARHNLVSLFRYAVAAYEARQAAAPLPPQARAGPSDPRDAVLALAPGVAVLRDIHDCTELLERIAADGADEPFDDASAGPLVHLLLVPQPSLRHGAGERDVVVTYLIDAPAAGLLERFARPQSYWHCCFALAAESGARFPDWDDLERLCGLGALVVQAEPAAVAALAER